jgi:adenosylmethionine-8-amino-7-oxononanoate aminotransferase
MQPANSPARSNGPAFSTDQLGAWDRQFLWHPFTPMKPWCEEKEIVVIERGEREFLIDTQGRRYIDGVSSLWCNVHGHCVPELDEAVRAQLGRIAHTTLLGLANVPSVLLGKRLVELMQARGIGLERVFYSDDGSTAVEVACKMAYQFWRNVPSRDAKTAASRSRFIALQGAYHGDTIGAVSLGGIDVFHQAFKGLCFPTDFVPVPRGEDEGRAALIAIEGLLAARPGEYAGIVIEPLVLGAGGMKMYPPSVLRALRELADRHNVLLIFDEVMTGFGRTGKMFATEHAAGVTPDLICLSKGLTAGYMPLGVTMTTSKIFDAFYADPREGKTFFHGHTFTGHPLACAVALASLDLFEQRQVLEHVEKLVPILDTALERCRQSPFVADARRCGLIGAIDLVDPQTREPFPYQWRIGGALCTAMRSLGLMMRPLADTIVIMPPLAISEENFRTLCNGVVESLSWLPKLTQRRNDATP